MAQRAPATAVAALALLLAGLAAPAQALAGGPDLADYYFIDDLELAGPTYDWVDISTSGTFIAGMTDDTSHTLPALPWTVDWYGLVTSTVRVSSNGYLCFGTAGGCTSYTPVGIPGTGAPNNFVAAYWTDLRCSTPAPVCNPRWEIQGTPGNRVLIVSIIGTHYYSGAGDLTFQFKLFEANDAVEVHYKSTVDPSGHCVLAGIEGPGSAGRGLTWYGNLASCGTTGHSWTDRVVRYYPFTFPEPVVDWKATPMVPCKGDPVQFVDLSYSEIGPPLSVMWDFGVVPPVTSSLASPTFTYTSGPADYLVTLTETYQYGWAGSKQKVVHVNGCVAPVCSFEALQVEASAVAVTEHASDLDGAIEAWLWDWGDKSPVYVGRNPVQHVYAFGGTYNIKLTVVDDEGNATSCFRSLKVHGDAPDGAGRPVADAGDDQDVPAGRRITLDGSGADADTAVGFAWSQVAGPIVQLEGAGSARPSFMPAPVRGQEPDLYAFALSIYDGRETSEPDVVHVTVRPAAPTPLADAGADQQVLSGAHVMLDASASTDPARSLLAFSWAQVSGPAVTLSDPASVAPTFRAPQVDAPTELTFQVTASAGPVTSPPDAVRIGVVPAPQAQSGAGFTVRKMGDVQPGLVEVRALAEPIEGRSFQWDFGDGSAIATGPTVLHVYQEAGTYLVTLQVAAGGETDVHQQEITVQKAPTLEFGVAPEKPSPGPLPIFALVILALAALAMRRKEA